MAEIWKDVVGYEGLYQVSDRGRIKSICSYVRLQNGELMKKKPHILKLQDRCGYKCVNLFKGGRSHTLNIHRLVAEAFLPNPHRYSIDAPLRWLEKRVELINQKSTNIIVNRDKMGLALTIDETNYYQTEINGILQPSKEMQEFGINTEKKWEPIKLSKFLKMHRAFFTDKSQNMMLVSTLKNFKAKVNQDIERSKEENGSKVDNYSQVVDSNLPKSFKLNIPLFKGFANEEIEVEIYADVDGRDVSLSLVSAGANEAIEEYKNKVIDEQLGVIRQIAPGIVIIEV